LSEFLTESSKGQLVEIIRILCAGGSPEALIQEFDQACTSLSQDDVSDVFNQLHSEGLNYQGNHQVIAFYQDIVESKLAADNINGYAPGHPVRVFLEENLLTRNLIKEIGRVDLYQAKDQFQEIFQKICEVEKHYVRKENQLFPYLEKHGWDSPSKNMWAFQDENRAKMKEIRLALEQDNLDLISSKLPILVSELERMMSIEEGRLLPNAMDMLEESEWIDMRAGDEEIGWMLDRVPPAFPEVKEEDYVHPSKVKKSKTLSFSTEGMSHFDEGYLSPEQVNFIFKFLPVDITYVDENDRVIFYNRGEERVFPRSPGIIGREVRFCHPPKSVDQVLRILEEFKKGTQDVADFWIDFKDRFIHIRYFAIRDDEKKYRGVIEMSQDVTEIRSLEGSKRLLDWD